MDHPLGKSDVGEDANAGAPVDRLKYSDFALQLMDQRGLKDSEDPEVLLIGLLDMFRLKILEDVSLRQLDKVATQFKGTLAHAEVEFGRIDLAIKALHEFMGQLKAFEKRFTRTTNKVLRQNIASIAINHVMPLIYVLFGVALSFALQKIFVRL